MIRLSAKSRYAVSALMHLAIHGREAAVPLAEISVCQGISVSYVDQIFTVLRHAELVRGSPGPRGGYRLTRPPQAMSIGEIVRVMEQGRRSRSYGGDPLTVAIWRRLSEQLDSYLDSISLADFVRRPGIRDALERQYRGNRWRCEACGALAQRTPPGGGA